MTCQITPGCENPCEGTTLCCASCNHAARKVEREALKHKKVYVIPKKTAKKAKEDSQYVKLKKEFLAQYPICQCAFDVVTLQKSEPCNKLATQIHHTSKSSKNYLNTESWMGVCAEHHNFIEFGLSAEFRRETGLLKD